MSRPPLRGPQVGDLMAGLSVGLVLVPQALAYAVLAGMPPARGLIVAVVATIAAAPFASSPYLQTGPVAITALLTFGALEPLATPGTDEFVQLGILLALLVGIMRLVIGLIGEGGIAHLLSQPVVAGFTPAAAIVIAASQIPTTLGVTGGEGALIRKALHAMTNPAAWQVETSILAALTVATVLLAKRIHPLLPGVLIAVVSGIVYARLSDYTGPVIGSFAGTAMDPRFALPWAEIEGLFVPALVIAVVGFGETAAIARTFAAETRTRWDVNREFVSQGVANLASGLAGGFPAGGSFSRSALARIAGTRTTWTGAISGVVALLALPFTSVLADLPAAILAGIILASVLSLIRVGPIKELLGFSRPQFLISATTFALTLMLAPRLQWALVAGTALAIGWHLRRETLISVEEWVVGTTLHLRPSGVFYFASAQVLQERLLDALVERPDLDGLIVHFDRLGRVDVSAALSMRDLAEEASSAGVRMQVADLVPAGRPILTRVLGDDVIAG